MIARLRPVLLAALLAVPSGCGSPPEPTGLLLVTLDTCRADRLGCYGAEHAVTPTLDALAEGGALFERASAVAPITAPSHASILTGLYPDRHTVRDNGAARLPDEALTLGEILEERGWRTGAFLSAVPLDATFGTDQGFATYDDDFVDLPPGADVIARIVTDQRPATDVTNLALDWLADAGREPWFAWVHYFDPHTPYAPPLDPAPGQSPYDAEITYVDQQLARLVEAVDENTLVCVIADHGEALGDHGERTHGFFLYDEVLRVPWLLSGPGVPSALRVEEPVSAVQVLPTLLELLGLPVPDGLDGESVVPVLRGEPAPDEPVFAEALFARLNFGWAGSRSVRRGSWKYIDGNPPELYDLSTDPGELRNVYADHPDRAAELEDELLAHWDRGGELSAASSGATAEMLERLEGLGYLGAGGGDDAGAAEEQLWERDRRSPTEMIGVFQELERLPQRILAGSREDADRYAAEMEALDPANPAILRRILQMRLRAAHWDAARELALRIHALFPEDVDTWRDRVRIALAEDRRPRAIEGLARVIELAPADSIARGMLATHLNEEASDLRSRGRAEAAAELLRAHLPALSDDVATLNNLAWTLADANLDAEAALRHASAARRLAPKDPVILDTYGWAAVRAGRPGEAVEPLRVALEATGDAEVRAHLGVALCEDGRPEEGRPLLKQATAERRGLLEIPEVERWLSPDSSR